MYILILMSSPADRGQSIRGVGLRRRRFTGWALLYFLVFFCLPVLGLALLLDLALFAFFDLILGGCYGVLCFLT